MAVRSKLILDTSDYKRGMREVAEVAEQTANAQTKDFEKAGQDAGKRGAKETVKGWLSGIAGLGLLIITKITTGIKGGLGLLRKATLGIVDVTNIALLGVAKGLRTLAQQFRESEGAARHMAGAVDVAASGLEKFVTVAWKVAAAVTGAKVATAALAAALAVASARASAQFTPSWNRVLTLLPKGQKGLGDLRTEVSDLAGVIGVDAPKANKAFYDILSALPALTKEPRRALDLLQVSLEADASGFAEASQAASALTTIMNAFKIPVEEARRVSDAMFATQDQGVTTFGEIAGSIGKVADLTANLGAEFEDVFGIIATVTPQGVETSEVLTQLRGVLANVLNASEATREEAKRLGIDFTAAGVRAKGLNAFLIDLVETTGGDVDVLSKFITSQEGLALMASLATHLDDLRTKTDNITVSTGKGKANLDQMNQSWERQKEILDEQVAASLRRIGERFDEMRTAGLRNVNALIGKWIEFNQVLERVGENSVFIQRGQSLREAGPAAWAESLAPPPTPPEGSAFWGDFNNRMFGGMLNRGNPQVPGVSNLLPPLEPASVEHSREKIEDLQNALQAQAVAQLAATRNVKEYDKAVVAADVAVNRLVLSEMQRLREAGVAEAEVVKLASAYKVLRDELSKPTDARISEVLSETLSTLDPNRFEPFLRKLRVELFEVAPGENVFARALRDVTAATDEATEAQLELTRARMAGEDTAEQERAVAAAQRKVREEIRKVAAALKDAGIASEHVQKILEMMADAAADVDVGVGEMDDSLEGALETAERVARAVLSIADAMGVLSDDSRKMLQGAIDVISGVQAALSGNIIGGAAQAFGGLVGVLSGIFGDSSEELRARRDQALAMADLERALRDMEKAIVSNLSSEQRESLVATLEGVEFSGWSKRGFSRGKPVETLTPEQLAAVRELERITGTTLIKDGVLPFEAFQKALEALRNLDLGAFADDLDGRLDALRFKFSLLGDEFENVEARIAAFIDALRGIEGTETFVSQLEHLLAEGGPGVAEAWIDSLAEMLADPEQREKLLGPGGMFSGLTAEEVQRLLSEGNELLEEMLKGGGRPTSHSVQIARSITEFQAVEVVAWLEDIAFTARDQLAELQGIRAILATAAGIQASLSSTASMDMAVADGAAAMSEEQARQDGIIRAASGSRGGVAVSFRDVAVNHMSEELFWDLWRRAGEEAFRQGLIPRKL